MKHGLDVNDDGEPIYWYDARKGQPKKRRTGPDGRVIVEKFPQGPFRRMVNVGGDIISLMVTAAAAGSPTSAYAVRRVRSKLAKGFLPADECPLATHRMPKDLKRPGEEPCAEYFDQAGLPTRLPDRPPCPHVQRIIDVRQAAKAAEAKQFETAFMGEAQRQGAAQGEAMRSLTETQKELVGVLKDIRAGGKTKADRAP